jgi:hypothetical protein
MAGGSLAERRDVHQRGDARERRLRVTANAQLPRSVRIGSKLFTRETFAVKCTREIAMRLLTVAERFCPNVVPEIRAAIEQEEQ